MKSAPQAALVAALALFGSIARADLTAGKRGGDSWGAPIVVLTETGAGHAAPHLVFALYASGRALYAARSGAFTNHQLVTLNVAEQRALLADLPLDRVGTLGAAQRVGADGATYCVVTWPAGVEKRDCLWGGFERYRHAPAHLAKIWSRLAHFTSPRARRWVPDRVMVRAQPWSDEALCGKPSLVPWPAGWPRPGTDETRRDPRSKAWVLTLPRAALVDLARPGSLATPKHCIAPIFADGKPYHLFPAEPAFPREEAWYPTALSLAGP